MRTRLTDSHSVQSEGVIYELHAQIEGELIKAFDKLKGPGSSAKLIASGGKVLSSTIPALSRTFDTATLPGRLVMEGFNGNAFPGIPGELLPRIHPGTYEPGSSEYWYPG